MKWLAALVLCAGCDQLFGVGGVRVQDASIVDAAPDTFTFFDAAGCYGTRFVTFCPTQPLSNVTLGDVLFDTDPTSAACQEPTTGNACVVAGFDIIITGHVVAVGQRPLALVAARDLVVTSTGNVDVSSHRAGASSIAGAASDDASCATVAPYNVTVPMTLDRASGGPGGSFAGTGGSAGLGGDGATRTAPPPLGSLSSLRGGCQGSRGGHTVGALGGGGGDSGGAVTLVAGRSIDVEGRVLAPGAGGIGGAGGGPFDCTGGGGGGSGGAIVLDAPTIAVHGTLFASGGGGGGGGEQAVAGMAGTDPLDPNTAAAGGSGGASAGSGGNGSGPGAPSASPGHPTGTASNCGSLAGGGGGGGGGAGFILIPAGADTANAVVVPTAGT